MSPLAASGDVPSAIIDDPDISDAVARFRAGESIRAEVSSGGMVALDRPLPFLFVHRSAPDRPDTGTEHLLLGEASYLTAGPEHDPQEVSAWVKALARAGSEMFGSFLVLEIWSLDKARGYSIRCPAGEASETTATLSEALEKLAGSHRGGPVELEPGEKRAPDGALPLLTIPECHEMGVLYLGLRIPGVYRDPASGTVYPVYIRTYRDKLSQALRGTAYAFAQVQTDADLSSSAALGTRTVPDEVWAADAALAAVQQGFRFLMLVSPTNAEEVWDRFRADGYDRKPSFHYRLLPVDPAILKRKLYAIKLESIPDPSLGFLLREKRDELDKQISMLSERQTRNFMHGSVRLYGATPPKLRALAARLLETVRTESSDDGGGAPVDAAGFVSRAEQEIAAYAAGADIEIPEPQLRPDIVGLMVSNGVLMVGQSLRLEPRRVEALIHHEVGTHVLTYANGRAQPLAQLYHGLAGYDEFQEGIAVITEYIAGGLNVARLRLLAGRVLGVASIEDGASFMDTFRLLRDEYGFSPRGAFDVTTRVHQSGGFTRDMIYLRGVTRVLEVLARGVPIEKLFVGKFAAKHLDILEELRLRGVLREPPLRPHVLDLPHSAERIDRLRRGIELADLAKAA
jgi:uncharacterized protein (TIGR02421 family)